MGDYELDEIQNAHEVTRAIGGRFWSEETLYFQARVEAIGRKLLADRNAGKADAEARIAELERALAALQADNERMTRFVASLDNDAAAEKCVAVERYLAQSVLRYREERDELEALLSPLLAELSALRPLSEAGTQGEWGTNAAPGWLSVNVRLPDHPGREVLATDGPHCTVATYSSKRWWSAELGEGIEVTHWMPLPGPPPEADDARRDAAAEKARKP